MSFDHSRSNYYYLSSFLSSGDEEIPSAEFQDIQLIHTSRQQSEISLYNEKPKHHPFVTCALMQNDSTLVQKPNGHQSLYTLRPISHPLNPQDVLSCQLIFSPYMQNLEAGTANT
ncbi:hypothetical protein Hanom_Chr12g01178731 [Helianthus anomalus]